MTEEKINDYEKNNYYNSYCQDTYTDSYDAIPDYKKYKITDKDIKAEFEEYEAAHQEEWTDILNEINKHIIQDTTPKTYELIKHLLGRKWRANLETLGILIQGFKFITRIKSISCVTIARTSKRNLMMFGNEKRIRQARDLGVKVGLIYLYDKSYRFNAKKGKNKAQRYIWNKAVEHILSRLIKTENIFVRGYKVNNDVDLAREMITAEKLLERHPNLRFDYMLRLNPLIQGKYYASDIAVTQALKEQYPQLRYYMQLADTLNEKLPAQDQIVFRPSIQRSTNKRQKQKVYEFITKIGIRAYNDVCSMKSADNELNEYVRLETGTDDVLYGKDNVNDSSYIDYLKKKLNVDDDDVKTISDIDRRYYLREKFGSDTWFEYDVPASIYRVSYSLANNGYWLDDDIDLYNEWCGEGGFREGGRDTFKKIAMRFYFSPSIKYLWAKTRHIWLKGGYNVFGDTPETVKKIVRDNWFPRMFERMISTIGYSLGSEIFLHESCIYMEVQRELMKSGADVSVCYDCFYWHYKDGKKAKYTPGNIAKLIAKCAKRYYSTWIEPFIEKFPTIASSKKFIEEMTEKEGMNCSRMVCYPRLVDIFGDKLYDAAKDEAEKEEKENKS